MKLVAIPEEQYKPYRMDVIFNAYKWDPQFLDNNTIARHILLITPQEHAQLQGLTERLFEETLRCEEMLNQNLALARPLALPRQIRKELESMQNYRRDGHIRLMRFDFHPTAQGGWALSEVNSDVPGGFAEASLMPQTALELLGGKKLWFINFGDILAQAIAQKAGPGGRVLLVHCTSYSDDRQVMQFLGDKLAALGLRPVYAAADHVRFEDGEAVCILDGNTGRVDALLRFTPLEWLVRMRPRRWQGYFNTHTPSCNHPIAIFAQTKRFPLVWNALQALGAPLETWRSLLPETLEVKAARGRAGFIFKPACGRVGEGIGIPEACRENEYKEILKDVKQRPKKYLAQRRFESLPLPGGAGGAFHVCLGAYGVQGAFAGYYARVSHTPRIDSHAADIPVLIEGERI